MHRRPSTHNGCLRAATTAISSDLACIRADVLANLPPDQHAIAERYIRTLHAAFCDRAVVVGALSSDQLRELGVEVGHRLLLTSIANLVAERQLNRSTSQRSVVVSTQSGGSPPTAQSKDAPLGDVPDASSDAAWMSRIASTTGSQQQLQPTGSVAHADGAMERLLSFSRDDSYEAPVQPNGTTNRPQYPLPRIRSMDMESLSGIPGVLVTTATRAVFEPSDRDDLAGEGGSTSPSSTSSSGALDVQDTSGASEDRTTASAQAPHTRTVHSAVVSRPAPTTVVGRPQITTSFDTSLSSSMPTAQSPRGLLQGGGGAPSFFLGARPRQLQPVTSFHVSNNGGAVPLHTRSMRRRSHRGPQPKSFRGHSVFEDELIQSAAVPKQSIAVPTDTFRAQSPRPSNKGSTSFTVGAQNSDEHRPSIRKASEVEWLSVSGRRPTISQFLSEMETIRSTNGFPGEYDNLFLEHKQMPCLILDDYDYDSFGLLLRIPDLSDEYGTSITTITNRVCFMVHRTARLVVTYHACEEDPFDGFQREWEAGRHASTGLERIAETMIRRVLRTYNKGVAALREAVDELESREPGVAARKLDDTARVQRLSLIAKKSAVYKRCADATRETLAELEDVEWMEPFAKTLCDGLATVASMTDELASNALASIDLTIALSEFKSNTNLKNFTYMSILLQPVAIATSWYGMNWANMPELEYENAYYIFAVVTWVVAALIFSYFVLHGRILDAFRPSLHGAEGVQTNDGESLSTANKSDSDLRPWRRFSRLLSLAPVAPRAASVAGNASGEGSSSPLKKDGGSGGSSGSGNVLPDEQPSVPLDDTLGPPVRSGTISNKRVSDDVVLLPVVDLEGDVNPLLPH